MLHAYVDESERNEDYYFLSAVVGSREQIFDMCEAMKAVMRKHAETFTHLRYTDELHGSTIMRADEKPWQDIPIRARMAIYLDALVAIEESDVGVYIEGINIQKQITRGYPELIPARELAFSHLFERINDCAKAGQTVRVHADDHHTAEVSRSNFRRYQNVGTYGYKSSKLPNIEPEILFEDSEYELGLQAADLVTYIYNRWQTVAEQDPRADRAKIKLWGAIDSAATYPRGFHRVWP